MTRLILATRNAGKITELRSILTDAGPAMLCNFLAQLAGGGPQGC